ncbi:hypothetical protein EJ070_31715 [Mesorhizobium sp. M1E.F.Ca.ET.045.02.1.1]|uniref:hypothetical protein n=1 Tax=Mesorhizobium sp. M1E.F.Ca.ET.045.02.1.1 TaxID=2493672 RepID=UPI000F75773A|nr:hypothetical protein [Mesorhizobium sp. M1E.F.Ca.ET.045.02.1.1]AZO24786.1 hypothetical protein EJ070_31715 [Mesorhizobium sp. M1E.F.Ca.ET.045.02.1.1]
MTGIRNLPRIIYLPSDATVEANQARLALGQPSFALVSFWRKTRGFPESFKGNGRNRFLLTDQLAKWIEQQGARCIRI